MGKVNFRIQTQFDDSASTLGLLYNTSTGVITNFSTPGADRIPAFNSTNTDLTSYPLSGTGSIVLNNFNGAFFAMSASLTPTASQVGLQIRINSADSFKIIDNPGTNTYFRINDFGQTGIRTNNSIYSAALSVNTGFDSILGIVVRANSASQSANLQEWQNSSGTAAVSINPSGNITASGNVIYNQTTTTNSSSAYTLALTDSGRFVEMTASVANTITVPASSTIAWVTGTRVDILQYGAGQTTISPAANVTINYYSPSSAATRTIKARYGAATLLYRGSNEWYLIGNLT